MYNNCLTISADTIFVHWRVKRGRAGVMKGAVWKGVGRSEEILTKLVQDFSHMCLRRCLREECTERRVLCGCLFVWICVCVPV